MTKPPRIRRYPVSSFGPEIMAALVKGSKERIVLQFPNQAAAITFQHRIHTLRSSMRKEDHPACELVSRARASRVYGKKLGPEYADDPDGKRACHLVIQPNDLQFADVVKAAGVEIDPPKVDVTEEGAAALAPFMAPDPYADFKS